MASRRLFDGAQSELGILPIVGAAAVQTISVAATEAPDTASFGVSVSGGNPAITVGATEAADTASFTVRNRHRITVGATEAPDVASVLLNNPSAIVPRKKGAAGPEADFRRRRAEVVVNGRVREVATTEDARRIIAAHVEKAKQKAKVIARREPDALPLPPTIEVNYASESLARMVEEANARIEQMYAQAFARAIARNQEDEDEIAVLLLH